MAIGTPVIFIGSGEASALERKVLIHSIRKHSRLPYEIVVFNGTHNTIEREGRSPEPARMSMRAKYKNITEFSNYRFLIPELCSYRGRAIWLDSDMICLGDLQNLFEADLGDAQMMAKAFKGPKGDPRWGLSVALFDCAQCRFNLDEYIDEIESGRYAYNDLHQMTPAFLEHHPFRLKALDERWNDYDVHVPGQTQLIHYTNLHTQPWKVRGHRHGGLWFRYFREAMEAASITDDDVQLAIRRSYARPDVLKGNTISMADIARNALVDLKATVRDRARLSRS